jgi:hypothetical protein
MWFGPTKTDIERERNIFNPSVENEVKIQESLGWIQFIQGKIAVQWGDMIRAHLKENINMATSPGKMRSSSNYNQLETYSSALGN